jgi:hypothetical protein
MVTVLKLCLYFVKHHVLMVCGVEVGDEEAFSLLGGGQGSALHRIGLYAVGT